MLLAAFQISPGQEGGGPISDVSDFISYEDVDFEGGIEKIDVTVFANPDVWRSKKKRTVSVLRGFGPASFNTGKLPHVIFRRKEKRLLIKWQTQHLAVDEMETGTRFQRSEQRVFAFDNAKGCFNL